MTGSRSEFPQTGPEHLGWQGVWVKRGAESQVEEAMKKREAEMLEAIERYIEEGGTVEEALAAIKAFYGRKDEEDPSPRKH